MHLYYVVQVSSTKVLKQSKWLQKGKILCNLPLHYLELVFNGIDSVSKVEVVYTIFEKAFDNVDHGILLSILFRLGVRGKLLQLLESYLSERTFRVKIADSLSTPRVVTTVVPHGSLPGLLFFLALFNDCADCMNSSAVSCAQMMQEWFTSATNHQSCSYIMTILLSGVLRTICFSTLINALTFQWEHLAKTSLPATS